MAQNIEYFFKKNKSFFLISSLYLTLIYFLSPFFTPLLLGSVGALALSPFLNLLKRKFSHQKATHILMSLLTLIFIIPTIFFILRGATLTTRLFENPNTVQQIKLLQSKIIILIENYAPTIGLDKETLMSYSDSVISQGSTFIVKIFSSLLTQLPHFLLTLFILTLTIYSLLLYEERLKLFFSDLINDSTLNFETLKNLFQRSAKEVFLANLLTGLAQAFLVATGAVLLGHSEWFLIFFITYTASFIPLVGAGPVAFVLGVFDLTQGFIGYGIGLLILSGVAGLTDNILRTYFAARGGSQSPALINFLSVLGAVFTIGLPGLFLGPFIASVVFGLYHAKAVKHHSEEVSTS